MRFWDAFNYSASASAAARAGAASSGSAAPSSYSSSGKSVISRQFTPLRDVVLASAVTPVRHGCSQRPVRSCRPSEFPARQLRAFAAGSSSSRSATAAPTSRRTAQRAWAEQKSSSQALYLASTSIR